MTLRTKTLLLISSILIGLIIILYIVLRSILLDGFATLESNLVTQRVETTETLLGVQLRSLHRGIKDWSSWDDTYRFAGGENETFVDDNVSASVFDTLHINLMMFLDTSGEIIGASYFDFETIPDTVTESILNAVRPHAERAGDEGFRGILTLPEGVYFTAARQILQNDDSGPSRGLLIWARRIGEEDIADMSEQLGVEFDLRAIDDPTLSNDYRTAINALSSDSSTVILRDDNTAYGYSLMSDIDGVPAIIVKVIVSRNMFIQGQVSLNYFIVALAIVGVMFSAAALIALERLVLLPLTRISHGVRKISALDDFSVRLPAVSKDELGLLVEAINHLLVTVTRSQDALQTLNAELEQRVDERTVELEQQRSQLQAIMDNMSDGVIATRNGQIMYMNRGMTRILGFTLDDMIDKPCTLFDDANGHPLLALPPVETLQVETSMLRKDGSSITVVVTETPLPTEGGGLIIIRDITREKTLQQEREHFFARASHELRTPLSNIITRLYLLEKQPEELASHLAILNTVASHMRDLINDLLDVSRFKQGRIVLQPEETAIQDIVRQVVEVQRTEADAKLIALLARMQATPLYINGDPKRLRQIVTNLITNAIRYTPSGGQVIAEVFRVNEQQCAIRIRDTGIGIGAEHLSRLFDPFFRVNDENGTGTGLGLYIVKELVEMHGGVITVESTPGKGSLFCVTLPLSEMSDTRMLLKATSALS